MTEEADTAAAVTYNTPPEASRPSEWMEEMRAKIAEGEAHLADARENAAIAAEEIDKIAAILDNWRRFSLYQEKRIVVLEHRIKSDREQLRMEEDYASGVRS